MIYLYPLELLCYAAVAVALGLVSWWLRRLCYELRSLTNVLWQTRAREDDE